MLKEDISGFETLDNYMKKTGLTEKDIEKRCLARIKQIKEKDPSLAKKIETILPKTDDGGDE